MLKRLAGYIKEYRTPTVLTLLFIVAEVIIEVFIPFITANLVNKIKAGAEIEIILNGGIVSVLRRYRGLYLLKSIRRLCQKPAQGTVP